MTTETKAYEFKVGDQVWCLHYGKGVVSNTESFIEVDYGWTAELYTPEGVHVATQEIMPEGYSVRTLFFSEPKIKASVVRPLCEPSGQASCPSAFVPTLVGKTVMLHTKSCGIHNGEITSETQDALVVNYVMWNKSGIEAIYEVSSENLLTKSLKPYNI